ncbi:MAG: secondary thiamine-phosphate synthase enzyme YjbQ [Nanoarchaeota archaeon]
MPSFSIQTEGKESLTDITAEVERLVAASGAREGVCSVYVPHATAALAINENADPAVQDDILEALRGQVKDSGWRHDRIDGNAAAHIKAAIIGPSETIPIREGKLALGTWQDIFLCDFDGPRQRKVLVTIIKA